MSHEDREKQLSDNDVIISMFYAVNLDRQNITKITNNLLTYDCMFPKHPVISTILTLAGTSSVFK